MKESIGTVVKKCKKIRQIASLSKTLKKICNLPCTPTITFNNINWF